MYDTEFNVLGLMSGTSLDGMDAALVQFSQENSATYSVLKTEFFVYPSALKSLVKASYRDKSLLASAHQEFTDWTIACIKTFQNNCADPIHLIGTHGQTIFHEPKKKRTLQIGGDAHIAKATGLPLVCNFRMQDVLLGGNGAPLVPFGDHRLFGSYEAALNLGGFANVSIGNPLLKDGVQSAFDIAPANILFNPLAEKLGHPFDKNGAIAASGRINNTVLEALNRLDYYQELGPKSLGFEWVEENVSPLIAGLSPEEALRTLVEHLALQLQRSLGPKKTIVTGGGAFNSFLIQRCLDLGMALELPPSIVINYKEAIVFALLANERYHGRINVLGNTTGSGILHSSGSVFLP